VSCNRIDCCTEIALVLYCPFLVLHLSLPHLSLSHSPAHTHTHTHTRTALLSLQTDASGLIELREFLAAVSFVSVSKAAGTDSLSVLFEICDRHGGGKVRRTDLMGVLRFAAGRIAKVRMGVSSESESQHLTAPGPRPVPTDEDPNASVQLMEAAWKDLVQNDCQLGDTGITTSEFYRIVFPATATETTVPVLPQSDADSESDSVEYQTFVDRLQDHPHACQQLLQQLIAVRIGGILPPPRS
jgi:Ca2+-binding EF-hand superfamily protein